MTPLCQHGYLFCDCRDAEYMSAEQMHSRIAELEAEVERLRAEVERLRAERDIAIRMLADWCVAVDGGGADWDSWDHHYKNAKYRPGPLRELLDAAIDAARENNP